MVRPRDGPADGPGAVVDPAEEAREAVADDPLGPGRLTTKASAASTNRRTHAGAARAAAGRARAHAPRSVRSMAAWRERAATSASGPETASGRVLATTSARSPGASRMISSPAMK